MHLKRWLTTAGFLVLFVTLAVVVGACGDDSDDDNEPASGAGATAPADGGSGAGAATVDVRLVEWSVEPSVESVPPGRITFAVDNIGTIAHNMKVVSTDVAPDALPVDENQQAVDETQVEVVASSSDLDAGATEEVTADLQAGSYVLICNIPTHYELDMFVGFTVE